MCACVVRFLQARSAQPGVRLAVFSSLGKQQQQQQLRVLSLPLEISQLLVWHFVCIPTVVGRVLGCHHGLARRLVYTLTR